MDQIVYEDFKNLSLEELKYLAGIYVIRLKTIKAQINKRKNIEDDDEVVEYSDSSEVGQLTKNMIIKLGFTNNTLYHREAVIISKLFYQKFDWISTHGGYSNTDLSACIATAILDYYGVNYDPTELLNIYDINKNGYYKLLTAVKQLLHSFYWI